MSQQARDQAKSILTPTLTLLGGRWINATKKRDIYKIGVCDLTAFAHRITQMLDPDDPRYVGMAHLSRYMQILSVGIGLPEDPNMGMEAYTRESKPLPLPEGHVETLAKDILDDLADPKVGQPIKSAEG